MLAPSARRRSRLAFTPARPEAMGGRACDTGRSVGKRGTWRVGNVGRAGGRITVQVVIMIIVRHTRVHYWK